MCPENKKNRYPWIQRIWLLIRLS